MASQSTPSASFAASLGDAFKRDGDAQKAILVLLKDLIDLRNTVDALVTALNLYAGGTVTFASAAVGDDITVGATTFVATNGAVVLGTATYDIRTSDILAAASFANQVNAHATAGALVTAVSDGVDVVTLTARTPGVTGNAIALSSVDGATTAVTGSGFLTGGMSYAALTGPVTVKATV